MIYDKIIKKIEERIKFYNAKDDENEFTKCIVLMELGGILKELQEEQKKINCKNCKGYKNTCVITRITIDDMSLIRDKNFFCSAWQGY